MNNIPIDRQDIDDDLPPLGKWRIPIKSFMVVEAIDEASAKREFLALKELYEITPVDPKTDELIANAEIDGDIIYENNYNDRE